MSERPAPYRTGPVSVTHAGLVRLVTDYLAAQGAWYMKVLGGLGQRSGIGDVVAVIRGIGIMCECKTGSGRLSPQQKRERDAFLAAGGVFVEVRKLEDLQEALIEAGLLPTARIV